MSTYSIPVGSDGEELQVRSGLFRAPVYFRDEMLKTSFHLGFPGYRTTSVQTADGQSHPIEIRQDYLDIIPRIVVDGQEVAYRPPLPTWAKVLAIAAFLLLPVGVCLVGGWLAAVIGAVAGYLVLYMTREMQDKSQALILSLVAVAAAWGLWVLISIAALALILKQAGAS